MLPVSYHDGQLVCSGSSKFLRDLVLNVLLQKQQQRRTACCGTFHDCGPLSLCCNTTVMLLTLAKTPAGGGLCRPQVLGSVSPLTQMLSVAAAACVTHTGLQGPCMYGAPLQQHDAL